MAHAARVHFLLKLRRGQPGANLLLERQPPDTRVLDAVHHHTVDALTRGRERNRQGIHGEAWIDARAKHRHPRLLRPTVDLASLSGVRTSGIRQLLGRRHDGGPRFEDGLDLRQHARQRGTGAQHCDLRLCGFQRLDQIRRHLDAEASAELRHLAEIAPGLGGIHVDAADDPETRTRRDLRQDGAANRAEPDMNHPNRCHLCMRPLCGPCVLCGETTS